MKLKLVTRAALARIAAGLAVLAAAGWVAGLQMCHCPGKMEVMDPARDISRERLRAHVTRLADEIGPRNVFRPEKLQAAADYIEAVWREQGYAVIRHPFTVNSQTCLNLEASRPGGSRATEIIVVGAHYDTVDESPGANDNGSGVAVLLELARAFAGVNADRTIRFVAFPNEEPPFFQTPEMGSRVYARQARERGDRIVAMVSLETLGYYRDTPGSQQYPAFFKWFYPDRGNFVGFVANFRSRAVMRRAVQAFRGQSKVPAECVATFPAVPGVGWSDHASFWAEGYPAFMVTDTAFYRYAEYHTPQDTPEKLDYQSLAELTRGLCGVVETLANE